MQLAKEVLQPALVVSPEIKVEPLARLLLTSDADGACVIDEGRLVGVVTVMDLLFKQKLVQPPSYLAVLDAMIPLTSQAKWEHQSRKVAGGTARDIMTTPPITVSPSAGLDQVATLMVERHLTMLPVVDKGSLVGVITKRGLLTASGLAGDYLAEEPSKD